LAKRSLTSIPVSQLSEEEILTYKRAFGSLPAAASAVAQEEKQDSVSEAIQLGELHKYRILDPLVFGADLFQQQNLNFAPSLNIAASPDYVLGPGDVLDIFVYGGQEYSASAKITPNGHITIAHAGVVALSGLTLEDGTAKIRSYLTQNGFRSLSTSQSKLTVTLRTMRTINVTLVGVQKPGQYYLPALSTALHALYVSGGPGLKGTFRNIQVIRRGKTVKTLDLYPLLITGKMAEDPQLQEGDVVFVPTYEKRVLMKGEVKRPQLFELLPNERLSTLLEYAGGYTDIANRSTAYIERITDQNRVALDVYAEQFGTYPVENGDIVHVGILATYFRNRVAIAGAVHFPGYYSSFDEGQTLDDLLRRAGGLRPDAYPNRAVLSRTDPTGKRAYFRINPSDLATMNDALQEGDSLVILGMGDFLHKRTVRVEGEVNRPGVFAYGEGLTLQDALTLSGGLRLGAQPDKIEVVRRVEDRVVVAQILPVSTDPALPLQGGEFLLLPEDVVIVRANPLWRNPSTVELRGEFWYPGPYPLLTKNEPLHKVLDRAGGYTPYANLSGAILIRQRGPQERVVASARRKALPNYNDSVQVAVEPEPSADTIALSLHKGLRKGSGAQFVLRNGDVIIVPSEESMVFLRGMLNHPTQVTHRSGKRLFYYLRRGGGAMDEGRWGRSYVVYPNGESRTVRWVAGIPFAPKVVPGSTVVVPQRYWEVEKSRRWSAAQWATLTTALGTVTTMTIALLALLP
jgi:protein involved in polysaccharide export with SLBB domain